VDAVVAVTYGCNLHCVTCDLPARGGDARLTPGLAARLPRTLRYVNVTGGEPFLVEDIAAVVRAVAGAAPRATITVSTNGSLPARAAAVVRDLLPAVPGLHVAVSLDGLEAAHDGVRQVPGSFRRAVETVDALAPLLGRNVHVAFTLSRPNLRDFEGVTAFARGRGLPLSLAFTHRSAHYFRPRADAVPAGAAAAAALSQAVRFYLRELSPGAAARAYFAAGLACVLEGKARPVPCRAGDRFFYVDPAADVYLCNMRPEVIGNLARATFDELWAGEPRRRLLPTTGRACPVQCWMVCTARTAIRDHPARVAWWAARAYAARASGRPLPRNCG
jgi:MoaA/NifB/PqqE/SkfB family radical SAM enzyme